MKEDSTRPHPAPVFAAIVSPSSPSITLLYGAWEAVDGCTGLLSDSATETGAPKSPGLDWTTGRREAPVPCCAEPVPNSAEIVGLEAQHNATHSLTHSLSASSQASTPVPDPRLAAHCTAHAARLQCPLCSPCPIPPVCHAIVSGLCFAIALPGPDRLKPPPDSVTR